MVIDKPEHQQFLLELIKQAQYSGQVIDLACDVKRAVESASVPVQNATPLDGRSTG